MPMHLIAEEGPQKGKVLRFEGKDQWTIGRDPDQSDIILDDPTVSRKHVLCKKEPDGLVLEDLSHTNPILVNDQALTGEHLLKEGDRLKIGQNIFLYSEEAIPHLDEAEETIEEEIEEEEKPEEDVGVETVFLEETPEKEQSPYDTVFEDMEPPSIGEMEKPAKKKAKKQKAKEEVEEEEEAPVKEETTAYDTIFEDLEEPGEIYPLVEEPKLILKVLSGPNTGAEFALETNKTYLLGKDPNTCDIAFNDLSVSKHHANLTIDSNKIMTIEDLGSKNKTYVNSRPTAEKTRVTPQDLITIGTTTFVVVDKEAEAETIYTPSPAIIKEEEEEEVAAKVEEEVKEGAWRREQIIPFKHLITAGALGFILLISVVSFFALFSSHDVELVAKDVTKDIAKTLDKYPSVTFSYNPRSENLFLMGHVLTSIDKQEMLHDIKQLPYIGSIDDNVIIDELVWKNVNGILSDNPAWRSVSVHSPKPGKFIVTGYIKTTTEAEELADYLNMNFPYIGLLENKVVIEDVLNAQISSLLRKEGFDGISFGVTNGDVILTGQYDEKIHRKFTTFLDDIKSLHGVREITNLAIGASADTARIDLSQKYSVTGYAKFDGENYSVVINGLILATNDLLDGMKITSIKQNAILLEKDQVKYKINYSQASQ